MEGAYFKVVVCVQGGTRDSLFPDAVCPIGYVSSTQDAYLITDATGLQETIDPFDPATAGSFFSFALVSTLFVYLISHGAGVLLTLVRRG